MRDRLSINPLSTGAASLEHDLALSQALGFKRTVLTMHKVMATGADRAAELVRAGGMAVDAVYPNAMLDLSDASTWPTARRGILDAAQLAETVGAPSLVFAGGAGRGMAWEDCLLAFERAVGPVIDELSARSIRLLLEPVRTRFAYVGFVHSLRDGVDVARRFGIGLTVDVTHCWWEPHLAATIAANVDLIGTVHLADLVLDQPVSTRVIPGDGDLPLGALIAMFAAAGYGGGFELEIIGPAVESEGVEAALRRAAEHVIAGCPRP